MEKFKRMRRREGKENRKMKERKSAFTDLASQDLVKSVCIGMLFGRVT